MKNRKKLLAIGLIVLILILGIATIFISSRIGSRQAIAPTAPTSKPSASSGVALCGSCSVAAPCITGLSCDSVDGKCKKADGSTTCWSDPSAACSLTGVVACIPTNQVTCSPDCVTACGTTDKPAHVITTCKNSCGVAVTKNCAAVPACPGSLTIVKKAYLDNAVPFTLVTEINAVAKNQTFVYNIVVTNTGTTPITNATVTDVLNGQNQGSLVFKDVETKCTYTTTTKTISCPITSLAGGATVSFSFRVTATGESGTYVIVPGDTGPTIKNTAKVVHGTTTKTATKDLAYSSACTPTNVLICLPDCPTACGNATKTITTCKDSCGTAKTKACSATAACPAAGCRSELTLDIWFVPTDLTPTWQTLANKNNTNTPCVEGIGCGGRQYAMYLRSDGSVYFQSTSSNNVGANNTNTNSAPGSILINQMYHVVGVVDSQNKLMTLYLNGAKVDEKAFSDTGIRTADGDLYFGGEVGNPSYRGIIYEASLSNVARSASEITNEYNDVKAAGVNSASKMILDGRTIGLWHFDEESGTGAYLTDSSPKNNDGTPTGTTYTTGILGKGRNFNGTGSVKITNSDTISLVTCEANAADIRVSKRAYWNESANVAGNYELKTEIDTVAKDQTFVYSIMIENIGDITAPIAVVSDTLSGENQNILTFVDGDTGCTYSASDKKITCTGITLAAGATAKRSFRMKVATGAVNGDIIKNTGSVAYGTTNKNATKDLTISTVVSCNNTCTTDDECSGSLVCDEDTSKCRNSSCLGTASCTCPTATATPTETIAPTETVTPTLTATARITAAVTAEPTVLPETGILDFPGVAAFGGGLLLAIIGILLAF